MSYPNQDMNSNRLSSIRTYLLIGFIFVILTLIGWILLGIIYLIGAIGIIATTAAFDFTHASTAVALGISLGLGIFFLLLALPTVLVFRRINTMRNAANIGNIATLKQYDSVGWGIVALIFVGIIPGIMMLIAHGPIQDLSTTPMQPVQTHADLDRLTKLKALLDSGVITREEFDAQKNMLLNPAGAQRSGSVEDQLTKLKSLYDSGVLSKAEYDQQREQLLRRL
jgi:putative membrane protein